MRAVAWLPFRRFSMTMRSPSGMLPGGRDVYTVSSAELRCRVERTLAAPPGSETNNAGRSTGGGGFTTE
jgi:hypothetical protein